jgi:hypothetical protein
MVCGRVRAGMKINEQFRKLKGRGAKREERMLREWNFSTLRTDGSG